MIPAETLSCVVADLQHPHFGCRGYIKVSESDTVTVITMFGKRMVEVFLTDCPHGTSSCYVPHKPGAVTFFGVPALPQVRLVVPAGWTSDCE